MMLKWAEFLEEGRWEKKSVTWEVAFSKFYDTCNNIHPALLSS